MFALHKRTKDCWDWEKNKNIDPDKLTKGSRKEFWLVCDVCNHSFKTHPKSVLRGVWCPFCSNKELCSDEECEICFNKSFETCSRAKFWNYELNETTPRMTFISSGKSFWFTCGDCGHDFHIRLNMVKKGKWCGYCTSKRLCENENCETCLEKSFASHPKSVFWSMEDNKVTPRQVFKNSGEKYWFLCGKCNHKFQTYLTNISKGVWCPYCAGKKLCDLDNCISCFNRSFASHPLARFWFNNKKTARQVSIGNSRKYKFMCEKGHEFEMSPDTIKRGSWCPLCYRKGEKKLYEALKNENYAIIREKKFEWCINEESGHHFRFDFKIQNRYKVLIELDGKQHFHQVGNWDSPEETQQRDLHKMNLANENGYAIIRITWEMVFYNRSNWKAKLIDAIETIEPSTRLYICTNGEYDIYQTEAEE